MRYITLEDANKILRASFGDDVRIVLEPDDVRTARANVGQEDQLWCFDPTTGRIARADGRFCAAGILPHPRGYGQLVIIEEPSIPPTADGGPRIVGQISVRVNPRGLIKAQTVSGIDGEVLQVNQTSLSGAEPVDPENVSQTGRLLTHNPQRISGSVEVVLVLEDFPDSEGMTPEEFRSQSGDSRSLAALAVLGL